MIQPEMEYFRSLYVHDHDEETTEFEHTLWLTNPIRRETTWHLWCVLEKATLVGLTLWGLFKFVDDLMSDPDIIMHSDI